MNNPSSGKSNRRRTAFVTGAGGYVGAAVCRAFARAGWQTFGFVRRPEAADALVQAEIIPVLGTFTNLDFLDRLYQQTNTFDVIVSCTEQIPDYATHFDQVLSLVQTLADVSNANNVKPLVLWSTGCKDYGTTALHGASDLAPHTEVSSLNGPEILQQRAKSCITIFDHDKSFDAVLLRPTGVFGYGSSFYGALLSYAAQEAARGAEVLEVPADANSIMHAVHIDDCAEAYLALAEYRERSAVAGQIFNISSHRYETTGEVGAALAKEYGFAGGLKVTSVDEASSSFPKALHFVTSFSQWVGSDKIRKLTGWTDRRQLFSEDMSLYRRAYEAAEAKGDTTVAATKSRISVLSSVES